MIQETLTPKLVELEARLTRLTGRIYRSQEECLSQLEEEIQGLSRESAQEQNDLELQLTHSKAEIAPILQAVYHNIQLIIQEGTHLLEQQSTGPDGGEESMEEKILLAEYALDFAFQAADRALLAALQAMTAQLKQEQEKRSSS